MENNQPNKSITFVQKDSLPSIKQKELFYKLVSERMDTIEKLHNRTDFKNLTY